MSEQDIELKPYQRGNIAKFNREQAEQILAGAQINVDNPNYSKYLAFTMSNVHQAGRFGVYDRSVKNMFIETLKDKDLTLEQYKGASHKFVSMFSNKQFNEASGNSHNDESAVLEYDNFMQIIHKTVAGGIDMRLAKGVKFPKEFYNENDTIIPRLEVKIPTSYYDNSAMGVIDEITNAYSDINFDKESNQFDVKGQKVGPEKFFKGRADYLEKFKIDEVDFSDQELFDIIKSGDFVKFTELRKVRGMNKNRMNETVRKALGDKVVFSEISHRLQGVDINKDNLQNAVADVKTMFEKKADIIRTEAQKDVLAEIDTVIFTIRPYDIATQSTFRDWKSCMHAVGCYHYHVDDTIGVGSIIAYGYNSENPQKMVSRLLINPYTNSAGDVIYKANDKIYGKENIAFRQVVKEVIDKQFNKDKPDGAYGKDDGLYDDGDEHVISRYSGGTVFESSKYVYQENLYLPHGVNLDGVDISNYSKVIFHKDITSLKGVKLPKDANISQCSNLDIAGVDFSNCDTVVFPQKIESLEGTKLPQNVSFSNCEYVNFENADLSNCKSVKFPKNITGLKGSKLPKNVDFSDCEKANLDGADLSNCESVVFPNAVPSLIGAKLPENVDFGKYRFISFEGTDLSNCKNVIFPLAIDSLKGAKLPANVDFSKCDYVKLQGVDLSRCESVKFPRSILGLSEAKLPKIVDLSNCGENVDISGIDLSNCDKVSFPPYINSLEGVKLPKVVDFSKCDYVSLKNADFSNCESVVFPKNVIGLKGVKFPKNVNFGNCEDLRLEGFDFSNCDTVVFPQKIESLEGTKLPKNVNLGCYKNVNLQYADLSNCESLKFPANITSLEGAKLPKIVDFSNCEKVNLGGADLSNCDKVILPKIVKGAFKHADNLDFGNCEYLELSQNLKSWKDVKVPKNVDLSSCSDGNFDNIDFSNCESVKLPHTVHSVKGVKFTDNIDFHCCYRINFDDADLSACRGNLWPGHINGLKGAKLPKNVDFSNCKKVDLDGVDLSDCDSVKFPLMLDNLKGTKLPKNIDFSNCEKVDLDGADLSNCDKIVLTKKIKNINNAKLPKIIDASACSELNGAGMDFSTVEKLIVGDGFVFENCDLSGYKGEFNIPKSMQVSNSVFPSGVKTLDLRDNSAIIYDTDLNCVEELILPENFYFTDVDSAAKQLVEKYGSEEEAFENRFCLITPDSQLNNLKKLDVSACVDVDLSNFNLEKIEELKLPKNFDVSKLPEGIMERNPAVAKAVSQSRLNANERVSHVLARKELLNNQRAQYAEATTLTSTPTVTQNQQTMPTNNGKVVSKRSLRSM